MGICQVVTFDFRFQSLIVVLYSEVLLCGEGQFLAK